jgi:small-conductance mechanosensitive channel
MDFVKPTAVEIVPFLVLLAFGLGIAVVRRRDLLAEPLKTPARLAQWLVLLGAVLSLVEAFTSLPVFEVLHTLRNLLNYEFTKLGDASITPITVGTGAAIIMVSWWLSALARDGLTRVMLSRSIGDEGSVGAIARLTQYALLGVGVAVGLQTLGLDLSAVLAAGAVFAVGFGLAMQHVAENFVSGVILLVERTIRPGDVLELETGELVRVQYLGIRSTVARTLNDEEIILPNSLLVQTRVKNLRLSDTFLRVRVEVGVSYSSDLRATMAALKRAAETFPPVDTRPPAVLLKGFGASSVDFDVSVWTRSPWDKQRVRSALALAVWDALHQDGITIAFPQLDLHLDPELVKALEKPEGGPKGVA